jgi:putative aldouronate transport system substrate-binding protein
MYIGGRKMSKLNGYGKRITALALVAAMTVSFTACGGKNDAENASQPAVSKVSDPMAKYDQPVTMNVGRQTDTNARLPKGDTFENNAYTRTLKDKLNIVIKDAFEANGEDYDRQVSLAMTGNSLPDMLVVDSRNDLKEMVENDQIADLTDVYNSYASDKIKEIYDSYKDVFSGGAFDKCTFDGKIMGLPDVTGDSGSNIVWVRQDWADKLGIKLDEDGDGCLKLDELKSLAKQFVEKDPGGTGKPVGIPVQPYPTNGDNDGGSFTLTGIANAFNAFPKRWQKYANGKVVYGTTTNETKEFLTTMAGWFKEGIIDPQAGTRTWDDCQGLLVNGQTGIAFGMWHMPDWCLNQVKEKDPKAEFHCYAIADKNNKVNFMHVAPHEKYVVVRKGYEHPEAVIKILNLFYDQLKGKNASTVMPNIDEALKMDDSTRPINIELLDADFYLRSYEQIMAGAKDKSKIDDIDVTADKLYAKEIANYNKDPKAATTQEWSHYNSRVFGLGLYHSLTQKNMFNWQIPAFTGTTDSMESMWTNLDKLENEATIKIITGAEQPSYFDTFVKDWKAQGGDQITSEIEKQAEK